MEIFLSRGAIIRPIQEVRISCRVYIGVLCWNETILEILLQKDYVFYKIESQYSLYLSDNQV